LEDGGIFDGCGCWIVSMNIDYGGWWHCKNFKAKKMKNKIEAVKRIGEEAEAIK